jgi:CHRD domain
MRKVAVGLFIVVGVLGAGAVAMADDEDKSGPNGARLNGYQEVNSISTRGFGSFHLKVNKHDETVDYTLTYGGLESAVTQAHIHFAQRAQNGGIAVWLCDPDPAVPPNAPMTVSTPPVCPPASGGSVSGTFDRGDVTGGGRGLDAGEWEELIAAIKVGHTYANVHTTGWPGGEIRGQINDRDQKEYTGPPLFLFQD